MILLLTQVGQLAKLDIQTQLKLSQRDLSNGLSYLIAEDLMVRFPLLMSQEKILLGLLAKSDLPMQKEFELKSKIFGFSIVSMINPISIVLIILIPNYLFKNFI